MAQSTYCLPTCSSTDGRFLSLAGTKYKSLAGDEIAITLASTAVDSLSFEIFDGETGGLWDAGTSSLVFQLFADPDGDGLGNGTRVGSWSGSGMSENAWYRIAVPQNSSALAESGVYFYVLKVRIAWGDSNDANYVEDDTEDTAAYATWSNFKISSSARLATKQFAFCAPLFSAGEAAIVYPQYPSLAQTTYDGTWRIYFEVGNQPSRLELWDGDMDFGSWDGTATDTDDSNTSDNTIPRWSGTGARTEGVATGDLLRSGTGQLTSTLGTGAPLDENLSATYRRTPAVTYQVIDPNGVTYSNSNPSGNQEWERFVIGKGSSSNNDLTTSSLPRGVYEVRISGMDLHNLNSWRYADGIAGVSSTGTIDQMPTATCPTIARSFGRGPTARSTAEISADGRVFTNGDNCQGQLGDGSKTDRILPTAVLKGDYPGTTYFGDGCGGVAEVGLAHTAMVAVLHDGNVYAWGDNGGGLLGCGSALANVLAPKHVVKGAYPGTSNLGDDWRNPITHVAAGETHMVCVSAAGLVYAWGKNDRGQLGDGTSTDRTTPVRVLKGAYNGTTYLGDNPSNPIVDVVAGTQFSLALAADGTVYAFGVNTVGQLGDNSTTNRNTPVRVLKGSYAGTTYLGDASGNDVTIVRALEQGGMAVTASGSVYMWGRNDMGQLGDSSTTDRLTPVRVLKGAYAGTTYLGDNSSNAVVAIAGGAKHALALTAGGQVFAWGVNAQKTLGDNTTTNRRTPVRVLKGAYSGTTNLGDGTAAVTALGAGLVHSLALTGGDNESYGWGDGSQGRLGTGLTTDQAVPALVARGARPSARGGDAPPDGAMPAAPPAPVQDVPLSLDNVVVGQGSEVVTLTVNALRDLDLTVNFFGSDGDLVGRPMDASRIAAGTQQIAVRIPGIPSGQYFLEVRSDGASIVRSIVVTR